jgi:RHS repeat-associated protein
MTRPNNVTTNYNYDSLSRLLSVLHQSRGSTIDGASYTLDAAGNRNSKADQLAGVTSNYGYDAVYELLQVTQAANTTESYTYDAVGNRLTSLGSAAWSYNTSNELTSRPGVTYAYDANGNTTSKTDSTGTTTYAWDYDNRLTSVTLPGSGGSVSYRYDPLGRRIYKSSSLGTSIYAYDGLNLVEETNSSGTAVARYSQGLNIDEPLAMLRSGTTSYYEADGLGSLTSLSNSAGTLANTYTYDSFGNLVASSGSIVNNFRYTGREFDTETNLYYYRARYSDLQTGRFLSEDPIRFAGSVNFYSYALNNPVLRVDPRGLIHQAWFEPPFDGRLHDDAAGGLEVLCKKGRNKTRDKLWLMQSIAVRFTEIVREGENADFGHINRLVDEAITLAFCDDTCGGEKPEPQRVPDTVNEQNWWQQFQQILKENPLLKFPMIL